MPIKFNIVKRGNPARPEQQKKYYPSLTAGGRMTLRQLAEEASSRSTLSTTDMMAAIETFLTIIPRELAKGNIVELGDFGSFWLRFTSEGAETPEEVRGDKVTSLIPRFMPGKLFKRMLGTARFEKLP